jgi:hypothetical protein
MRYSTYETLPEDALCQLLIESVKKILIAYDSKHDGLKEFDAYKEQVKGFLALIDEKKKTVKKAT